MTISKAGKPGSQVQHLYLSENRREGAPLEGLCGCEQAIKAEDKEAAVQCMVLKMLTDFTLMYNACVGVILKRDAEGMGARGASPPVTPSFKSGTSGGRTMNSILFR